MKAIPIRVFVAIVLAAAAWRIAAQDVPPGFAILDGDMIVPEEVVFAEAYFTGNSWTGGVVPYVFDSAVTPAQQAAMLLAMAEWEAVAAVDFVPRTGQGNYIRVRPSSTAGVSSAAVGMTGGSQNVNICCWTNRHHMAHELGHTLGLAHEHQRPDRDAWVTIVPSNISGFGSNFPILGAGTLATPYDLGSIMHYGQFAFSICGGSGPPCGPGFETILVDPPANTFWQGRIGHQAFLSTTDAQGLAARYGPPSPPAIVSISPATIPAGSGNTLVTVTGSGFLQGSQNPWGTPIGVQETLLQWGGLGVIANVVSPTQLTALIPSTFLATPGCVTVRVQNPAPGGGVSATGVPLTIEAGAGPGNDWRGAFALETFGSAVAAVGPTASGERAGVLVGAPGYEPDQRGRAQLRRGSTGALLHEWTGTAPDGRFGHAVSGIGDVNGDGFEDVAVGAPGAGPGIASFYDGRTGGQLRIIGGIGGAGTEFGYAIADVGDLDHDGLHDVAVGTPGYGGGQGLVEVFSGTTFAPGASIAVLRTLFGPAAGSRFGAALAGGVDVNGDGTPDVIAGAPLDDAAGAADAGSVSVHSGATGGLVGRRYGPVAGDHLGSSVAGLRDVTGDGRAEVLAGAPDRDAAGAESGAVILYAGGSLSPLQTFLGSAAGDRFGCAVSDAGDLDDDGLPDILIGAWGDDGGGADAGAVLVRSGRTFGLLRRVEGDEPSARLGWAAAGLDDGSKDGAREIVAGSPRADGPGGCADAGRVRVFESRVPPELAKVMLTEVSWGEPDGCEISNFAAAAADLSGWTVLWHDGVLRTSSPFPAGTMIAPGESVLVRDLGVTGPCGLPGLPPCAPPAGIPEAPPGTRTFGLFLNLDTSTQALTVALRSPAGIVADEVRLTDPTQILTGPDLGGLFRGRVLRTAATAGLTAGGVERVWGLDSNAGRDWTEQPDRSFGLENRNSGPRGTDPLPVPVVVINETDDSPDYIELVNRASPPVDLQGWYLRLSPAQNVGHAVIRPFPESTTLAPSGFLVLGDEAAPAELPSGVPYVPVWTLGYGNIPWGTEEYAGVLYDHLGRVVDVVRTTGHDDHVVHNHPRLPGAWNDFIGAAGRVATGAVAIARPGPFDTGTGADWRPTAVRTMGQPNAGFTGAAGHAGALDARLHDTAGGGGLSMILNAGPARAGDRWSFLLSFVRTFGQGPISGLGPDAHANWLALSVTPPWSGFLDARGSARLDYPAGTLPPGIQFDLIFVLQNAAGAFTGETKVLEFDT